MPYHNVVTDTILQWKVQVTLWRGCEFRERLKESVSSTIISKESFRVLTC